MQATRRFSTVLRFFFFNFKYFSACIRAALAANSMAEIVLSALGALGHPRKFELPNG